MKKQNLGISKKIISASLAALLASSSMAFMPAAAYAQDTSPKDVVVQELNKSAYGAFQARVVYDASGTRIMGYQLYAAKHVGDEVVYNLGSYHVDADVSSTPYVADLSDLDCKMAPDAVAEVFGRGTQVVQLGFEGDEYVYNGKGRLSPKDDKCISVGGEYVASKVSRIVFCKDRVVVYFKRIATDAYKEVEKLIDDIGEVAGTPECKARIDAAEEAYNWLPKYEKDLVSNQNSFWEAKFAYSDLAH